MVFTTEEYLEAALEGWPETLRRSNQLDYQVMSSTRTKSQLSTAILTSSFAQCQILLRV